MQNVENAQTYFKNIAFGPHRKIFKVCFGKTEKKDHTQLTFTCSKSTIETLEKGVKHVQN